MRIPLIMKSQKNCAPKVKKSNIKARDSCTRLQSPKRSCSRLRSPRKCPSKPEKEKKNYWGEKRAVVKKCSNFSNPFSATKKLTSCHSIRRKSSTCCGRPQYNASRHSLRRKRSASRLKKKDSKKSPSRKRSCSKSPRPCRRRSGEDCQKRGREDCGKRSREDCRKRSGEDCRKRSGEVCRRHCGEDSRRRSGEDCTFKVELNCKEPNKIMKKKSKERKKSVCKDARYPKSCKARRKRSSSSQSPSQRELEDASSFCIVKPRISDFVNKKDDEREMFKPSKDFCAKNDDLADLCKKRARKKIRDLEKSSSRSRSRSKLANFSMCADDNNEDLLEECLKPKPTLCEKNSLLNDNNKSPKMSRKLWRKPKRIVMKSVISSTSACDCPKKPCPHQSKVKPPCPPRPKLPHPPRPAPPVIGASPPTSKKEEELSPKRSSDESRKLRKAQSRSKKEKNSPRPSADVIRLSNISTFIPNVTAKSSLKLCPDCHNLLPPKPQFCTDRANKSVLIPRKTKNSAYSLDMKIRKRKQKPGSKRVLKFCECASQKSSLKSSRSYTPSKRSRSPSKKPSSTKPAKSTFQEKVEKALRKCSGSSVNDVLSKSSRVGSSSTSALSLKKTPFLQLGKSSLLSPSSLKKGDNNVPEKIHNLCETIDKLVKCSKSCCEPLDNQRSGVSPATPPVVNPVKKVSSLSKSCPAGCAEPKVRCGILFRCCHLITGCFVTSNEAKNIFKDATLTAAFPFKSTGVSNSLSKARMEAAKSPIGSCIKSKRSLFKMFVNE